MLTREIAELIEDYAPLESGIPGDELGLLAGDPGREVTGVITCWTPTVALLRQAAARGANLVICHEPLTWGICGHDPEAGLKWYEERHVTAKVPNQRRLAVILEHGLSVYRYHSNWDWAPRYGQVDMLVRMLELGILAGGCKTVPIYQCAPVAVGELALRAAETLELGPLRVVGDLNRVATRVAIAHGGLGQMFTIPEAASDHGADCALFGEMLDYTIRYCVEVDLPAIELGHCGSEHPGMTGMCEFLREHLPPELNCECLHPGQPWQLLG